MSRPRGMFSLATAGVLAGVPKPAFAHLVNSGLGPFYDGALHFLLSPFDLLAVAALALLAGLRGRASSRVMVLTLPAAWLAAGLIGLRLPALGELPWLGAFGCVILGALVAVDSKRMAPAGLALLAGLLGAAHGLVNGSALAVAGAGMPALFGIVAAVLVGALLVAAGIAPLEREWARVAARVAGSWVAAVGILMLGWLAAGTG